MTHPAFCRFAQYSILAKTFVNPDTRAGARGVIGLVVTGYVFNMEGSSIYITTAASFLSQATKMSLHGFNRSTLSAWPCWLPRTRAASRPRRSSLSWHAIRGSRRSCRPHDAVLQDRSLHGRTDSACELHRRCSRSDRHCTVRGELDSRRYLMAERRSLAGEELARKYLGQHRDLTRGRMVASVRVGELPLRVGAGNCLRRASGIHCGVARAQPAEIVLPGRRFLVHIIYRS
jgi:hypothetical protein